MYLLFCFILYVIVFWSHSKKYTERSLLEVTKIHIQM